MYALIAIDDDIHSTLARYETIESLLMGLNETQYYAEQYTYLYVTWDWVYGSEDWDWDAVAF